MLRLCCVEKEKKGKASGRLRLGLGRSTGRKQKRLENAVNIKEEKGGSTNVHCTGNRGGENSSKMRRRGGPFPWKKKRELKKLQDEQGFRTFGRNVCIQDGCPGRNHENGRKKREVASTTDAKNQRRQSESSFGERYHVGACRTNSA